MSEIRKRALPEYFDALWNGDKNFEIRKDDDDIQVGDELVIEEYENDWTGPNFTDEFKGRIVRRTVRYVLRNVPQYGLCEGFCIIGW